MIKKIYIVCLIITGGVLCPAGLFAQKWSDFYYIKNSDAWFTCENAAGLDKLEIEKISFIEAFSNKSNGDFINYYQSDNSYSFGGLTESFYRLKNVVFYGKVNYFNFSGKNMGGSSLFDPYFSPFDIVEYADSTAGEKKMEAYHLTGAISMPAYKNLLLGLKADYSTVSYYKIKDLRHTNDLMDMKITTGVSYPTKIADVGLNYYFRKRVEGTSYQSKGNTDQQFSSLISYGAFMGEQQGYSSIGDEITCGSNRPFVDFIHGISIQIDLFPQKKIHFFNELGIKQRNGYYGKKASTSIMFSEHEADIFQYKGKISLKKDKNLHLLTVLLKQENLINSMKSHRESTVNGNTTIVYYGKNEVLDRTTTKASLQYTGNLEVTDNNPEWLINTGISFGERDQIASLYPDYRKQDIYQLSAEASVERNIIHNDNMYSISLGGVYGFGGGDEKTDGKYTSTDSSDSYATLDRYLYREYEYMTSSRITTDAKFRYTKKLPQNYRIYGDIEYSFTKAFSTTCIGNTFGHLGISIGCIF